MLLICISLTNELLLTPWLTEQVVHIYYSTGQKYYDCHHCMTENILYGFVSINNNNFEKSQNDRWCYPYPTRIQTNNTALTVYTLYLQSLFRFVERFTLLCYCFVVCLVPLVFTFSSSFRDLVFKVVYVNNFLLYIWNYLFNKDLPSNQQHNNLIHIQSAIQ